MKKFLLGFFLLGSFNVCFSDEKNYNELKEAYEQSLYYTVAQENLKSLEWKSDGWSCDNFYDYVKGVMERIRDPQVAQKRQEVFKLIGIYKAKNKKNKRKPVIDTMTWQDLEILCGKGRNLPYLGSIIDRTHTEIGKVELLHKLVNPTANAERLMKRQAIIQELLLNEELYNTFNCAYKCLAQLENDTIVFWDENDHFYRDLKNHLFEVPILNKCNENPPALEVLTRFGQWEMASNFFATTLASVLLPIFGLSRMAGITLLVYPDNIKEHTTLDKIKRRVDEFSKYSSRTPFISFMSSFSDSDNNHFFQGYLSTIAGIYCGLSLKRRFLNVRGMFYFQHSIHELVNHVATYVRIAKHIARCIKANDILAKNFTHAEQLYSVLHNTNQQSNKLKKLLRLFERNTFKRNASLFSFKGNVLAAYQLIHEVQEELRPIFSWIGKLDAYFSMATLYKEFEKQNVCYCFVECIESERPYIELNGFWNPFVDPKKVVSNSIVLGNKNPQNIIITGPNAGGKSSILKSVAIALILGQSFGIVPAEKAVITPFTKIATHMNITDDISAGNSLFKSEVLRAQDLIKMIEERNNGEFCFIIMDEIFNGTTPLEGEAAAYSFAKHISSYNNTICLVATHFRKLTELVREIKNIMNYKVSVVQKRDLSIAYPFKLEPGVSNQHVALDILRLEGFSDAILDTAYAIVKK